MKVTPKQMEILRLAAADKDGNAKQFIKTASQADSLLSKGLIASQEGGPAIITDAGRALVEEN